MANNVRCLCSNCFHLIMNTNWTNAQSTSQHHQWQPPYQSASDVTRRASGCVVECRICNREVAGSNLSLGYFAPRSTPPSIPPGSVNEYQLRLGRQRQVWLLPIADERVGVQVKLWDPLRTRAIPECFCGGDSLQRGAISSVCTFTFLPLMPCTPWLARLSHRYLYFIRIYYLQTDFS